MRTSLTRPLVLVPRPPTRPSLCKGYELQAFSVEEKAAVVDGLAAWSYATGIEFVEVPDSVDSYGDLRFIQFDFDQWSNFSSFYDGVAGFAYLPGPGGVFQGDVFIDSDYSPGDGLYEFLVAHEIGHALGLRTPTVV